MSEDEEWVVVLLLRYVHLAVEKAPEERWSSGISSCISPDGDRRSSHSSIAINGRIDLDHSHFQILAGVYVEFYVSTDRTDLLIW